MEPEIALVLAVVVGYDHVLVVGGSHIIDFGFDWAGNLVVSRIYLLVIIFPKSKLIYMIHIIILVESTSRITLIVMLRVWLYNV